ncbi:hypothetical protein PGT21_016352 [Puccinia graminis f. sp. tritici]|uniref:Uncharacterized protein n=1 Tax=Puccinia graminis f. sp. tritici TaxID=56615 RepID=A0A5B0QBC9_PUCGR|nr:hypothetical protein PGT21_016352 [Puccinia graminis f. sp. tritici]
MLCTTVLLGQYKLPCCFPASPRWPDWNFNLTCHLLRYHPSRHLHFIWLFVLSTGLNHTRIYPPHLKLVTVFHHHRSFQYPPSPHFFTTVALVPVVLRFSFFYKPRRPNFPNRPSRLTA